MPELALTYAPEPPWLKPPAQSGLSIQDILSLQQGQRQQRQEGRLERQEERLMTESQLRQRALEQDMQMQQFKMDEEVRVRDDILKAETSYAQAAEQISSLLESGDVESATKLHLSAGFRHPALGQSKRYGMMSQRLEFAGKLKETERYHQDLINERRLRFGDVEGGPIEAVPIEGTNKVAVRVKGARTLHIVEPEQLDRLSALEYTQALRDLSAIDRELGKEPPHPTGKDEKGEKVPIISDKRTNLLKQRRAVVEKMAELATKQQQSLPATAPVEQPSTPPPAEIKDAEEVRSLFRSGRLSREEALSILRDKFQMEP